MRHAVLILCLGAALGCDSSPTSPASFDTEFTLAPGQSASFDQGAVRLKFVEVVRDNRCPINAICVTAGEGVARIELSRGLNTLETHEIAAQTTKTFEALELTVAFVNLQPYPVTPAAIPQAEYRATFKVSR